MFYKQNKEDVGKLIFEKNINFVKISKINKIKKMKKNDKIF